MKHYNIKHLDKIDACCTDKVVNGVHTCMTLAEAVATYGDRVLKLDELFEVCAREMVDFANRLNAEVERLGHVPDSFTYWNGIGINGQPWRYMEDGEDDNPLDDIENVPVDTITELRTAGHGHMDDLRVVRIGGKFIPSITATDFNSFGAYVDESMENLQKLHWDENGNDNVAFVIHVTDIAECNPDFVAMFNARLDELMAG